jgi:homoserine kinase
MIRVRVPATTANLGPGFDCMGLALDLWNHFELHLGGETVTVETHGEGAGRLPTDARHLVAATFMEEAAAQGRPAPAGFRVVCHNGVPPASGLGSSSTAILAGVILAQAWLREGQDQDPAAVDSTTILERATALEGHGDNVAPALLGGFVIVVPDENGVITRRMPMLEMKAVVCVPDFNYLTADARAALPSSYSKADAIHNIGRAMLVAEALRSGDDALLARTLSDRIHEPYRFPNIPGAECAREAAREAGAIAVALSGAGPGVIAFAREGFDRIGRRMNRAFREAGLESRYWVLDASAEGARIGRLPLNHAG